MNDILDKADEIIELVKSNENYKKYIELKEKVSKDKDIMTLIKDVKQNQQRLVKATVKKEDTDVFEKQIQKDLETLNNYPIYVEFDSLQKELNETLQYIKENIEKNINKITN